MSRMLRSDARSGDGQAVLAMHGKGRREQPYVVESDHSRTRRVQVSLFFTLYYRRRQFFPLVVVAVTDFYSLLPQGPMRT